MSNHEWKQFSSTSSFLWEDNPKTLCIIDEISCDGMPLVHSLISKYVKHNDYRVALVSFDKPLVEFVRVGRRLGCDLNLASIQNRFIAMDFVGAQAGSKSFIFDIEKDNVEDSICLTLNKYQGLNDGKKPLVLFVDDISTLLCLGWSLVDTMHLIKKLETLRYQMIIRTNRNVTHGLGLAKWLAHRFEVTILCNALISGISKQAHGEFQIYSTNNTAVFLFKCLESTLLLQTKSTASVLPLDSIRWQ